MALVYNIVTSNTKFGLLDSDDFDPDEAIARAKEQKAKEKHAKKEAKKEVPPPPPAAATAPAKPAARENKENIDSRPPRRNGPGNGPRGPRPQKPNGDVMAERFGEVPNQPREFNRYRGPPRRREEDGKQFYERRHDGEHQGEVGERPRRMPPRDRVPRENRPRYPRSDRLSGSEKTGVRPVPKKEGHGKGNWGNNNDELVGETEKPNNEEFTKEENVENENVVDNSEVEKPQEDVPEEEPEQPKFTLEEWKAQQKVEKPKFNTRKANEGSDKKSMQKFVPLKKDDDKEEDEEEGEGVVLTKRQQSSKTVDIRVNFNDPSRRPMREFRPQPNNRGGARPGPSQYRNNAFRRENRPRGPQIDLAHDFPALGAAH